MFVIWFYFSERIEFRVNEDGSYFTGNWSVRIHPRRLFASPLSPLRLKCPFSFVFCEFSPVC